MFRSDGRRRTAPRARVQKGAGGSIRAFTCGSPAALTISSERRLTIGLREGGRAKIAYPRGRPVEARQHLGDRGHIGQGRGPVFPLMASTFIFPALTDGVNVLMTP